MWAFIYAKARVGFFMQIVYNPVRHSMKITSVYHDFRLLIPHIDARSSFSFVGCKNHKHPSILLLKSINTFYFI